MSSRSEKAGVSGSLGLALAAFSCHFLIMAAYYVLKPVRSGIFLGTWGKEYYAWFLVPNAVVSFLASMLFGKLADKTTKRMLITGIQGCFIATIALFWLYFRLRPISSSAGDPLTLAVSFLFMLFIGFFVLFTVTPFWSLVNDLVRTEQGKRIFGLIGAGGTLGALAGSQITSRLATRIGTENLLPLSAGILALTIPIFLSMMRLGSSDRGAGKASTRAGKGGGALEGLRVVAGNGYVQMIAAVVVTSTFCMSIIDNQIHAVVQDSMSSMDEQTAFFGSANTWVSIVSMFFHLVITPLLLSLLGVGPALAILPAGLLVGGIMLLGHVNIHTLLYFYVFAFSAHYSINQVTKELLYVPCGDEVKYKAKTFIDTFGYRLGPVCWTAVAMTGSVFGAGLPVYTFFVIGASVLWLPMTALIHRRFTGATRGAT